MVVEEDCVILPFTGDGGLNTCDATEEYRISPIPFQHINPIFSFPKTHSKYGAESGAEDFDLGPRGYGRNMDLSETHGEEGLRRLRPCEVSKTIILHQKI